MNVFVDRHGWQPRYRSPWRAGSTPFFPRWYDFLPVFGWLYWRRVGKDIAKWPEQKRPHGLESWHFWIQPFLVELLAAVGTPLLYLWEVEMQMLLPLGVRPEPWETLVARYCVHLLLFGLLLAASLIDIDDMIIPDILTVTGTVLGLSLAIILPRAALPSMETRLETAIQGSRLNVVAVTAPDVVPLHLYSPNPAKPFAFVPFQTFFILSALWCFWCFAMMNRVWYAKLPFKKAAAVFLRKLWRTPSTKVYLFAAVSGIYYFSLATPGTWQIYEVELPSSLVGMATGMTLIWSVRLVGRFVLGREAMGFGDVTLMGMIGAFVGWQACILIFFLAPLAGLVLGIINFAAGRGKEFPYGPFLCLATAVLIVFWRPIWGYVSPMFELGGLVAAIMTVCLLMLGVLLWIWCKIRDRLFGQDLHKH